MVLQLLPRQAVAVHCGGHVADDCASCPQGHGASWCNGECAWAGDRCVRKSEVAGGHQRFAFPPDTRPSGCKDVTGDFSDLKVSIVIPWLAEAWEHMRDTLQALLHFTPDELVEEFMFISDGNPDSREKELKAISSKVKVLALKERHGLILAKMKGVDMAVGPVIVFMEAHCIVNRNWLQPLLERVRLNPKTLAMPALDQIPQDNWRSYHTMPSGHWRFEWNLNLVYSNPAGLIGHTSEPFPSPGTSGGIFAMRKDWFQKLGLFDPGMLEWGGDHVELTFKTWRCGGRIEIVPCSRIGHLFRDPSHRPYQVEVNQVVKNYARLARIWLKDHIDHFNQMKPESVSMKFDDLDEMMRRHDDLGCKDMAWYLENVDHEMAWEMDKICHPHAAHGDPIKCQGSLAPGRWTVNVTNLISGPEFQARVRAAAERQAKSGHKDGEL